MPGNRKRGLRLSSAALQRDVDRGRNIIDGDKHPDGPNLGVTSRPTDRILNEIGAERVDSGFNLVFDTSKDDVALRSLVSHAGINIVHSFRLYVDLLTDPQSGMEQANHLREEVIGW
ncbi:hypothetical protein BMS3Bbin02_02379 [bacterium BMS3Bbin02]|nr:hypothetical protein BMS3Bbin02_02379 [bacterium BMS3Bbin02]